MIKPASAEEALKDQIAQQRLLLIDDLNKRVFEMAQTRNLTPYELYLTYLVGIATMSNVFTKDWPDFMDKTRKTLDGLHEFFESQKK